MDIPTPPIERIADAVEQINNKIPDIEQQVSNTDQKKKDVISYLVTEGYFKKEIGKNSKYDLSDNVEKTIHRFIYNNYAKYEDWGFLVSILNEYTNHGCTLETLKRYVREGKKIAPAQLKNEKKMNNLRESM